MSTVGVRELRQRASELLRRVEAGETFEVTDRGRPVALLGPLRDQSPLDRLRACGDLDPGREDMDDLPEPLKLPRGKEGPSKVLERLRRDER
ncbi:MAG: type II toxin-antitoxin system prevent-host-death family antitoxin [Actinomycetota bacterium]